MLRKRRIWLTGIVLVLALSVLACYYLFDWSSEVADTAIQRTKQIVDAAAAHPVGTRQADVLPPSLLIDEECWQFLQETLTQNSGQYAIAVLSGNSESYDSRLREARAVVVINFPDGHHIPMEYFTRSGLVGCTGE